MPTYTGVLPTLTEPAVNTVDESCSARGGTCAPQNIPSEICLQGGPFGSCKNVLVTPDYWYLAQTSEPWQVRCSDIINGTVTPALSGQSSSLSGQPTQITASFTPNFGYTLAQAEQVCGFTHFDWQQTITSLPLPNPFFATNNPKVMLSAPPEFYDPPIGGYTYMNDVTQLPVYRDPFSNDPDWSLAGAETATTLFFNDGPTDRCLPGGTGAPCGGNTAPTGSFISFRTHLVGIIGNTPSATITDTGIGFSWTSTFNGTSGGADVLSQPGPVDPGSGSGGITILAAGSNTDYEAGEATPPVLVPESEISTTVSDPTYNSTTGTYTIVVTVTDTMESGQIPAPLYLVVDSLTEGVTLTDSKVTFGGWGYVAEGRGEGSLFPNQSQTFVLQFSNPADATISFIPLLYSGTL